VTRGGVSVNAAQMPGLWGVCGLRHAVRAVLGLGVTASVAANMLNAPPNTVGRVIAGWPPIALLVAVELLSRVPVRRRVLATARLGATTVIAGIAGWVSYGHMTTVAARYGETPTSARLIPLSVDGLIVVASICLAELTDHTATPNPDTDPDTRTGTRPDTARFVDTAATTPSGQVTGRTMAVPHLGSAPRPPGLPLSGGAAGTGVRVAALVAAEPALTATDVATRLGVSARTARRHLATTRTPAATRTPSGGAVARPAAGEYLVAHRSPLATVLEEGS
jgi:hypothetical protein